MWCSPARFHLHGQTDTPLSGEAVWKAAKAHIATTFRQPTGSLRLLGRIDLRLEKMAFPKRELIALVVVFFLSSSVSAFVVGKSPALSPSRGASVVRLLLSSSSSSSSSTSSSLNAAGSPATIEAPPVEETKEQTVTKEKEEKKQSSSSYAKRGGWAVRLFNDPMNKREFVAMCLTKVCGLNDGQAYQVMMQAHQQGLSIVGRYDYEIAELYRNSLRDHGLVCDMIPVEED